MATETETEIDLGFDAKAEFDRAWNTADRIFEATLAKRAEREARWAALRKEREEAGR